MFVGLEKLINPNDRVAVAISGGKDSVCLLHALLENAKKLNYSVSAINVEHGIRGQQSLNDTAFVKALCQEWGVTLYTFSVDAIEHSKANKLCVEESARILRYDCFYRVINECRRRDIPLRYFASASATKCVEQMESYGLLGG